MLMLLFFIIAFGSLEILKKYGLQIKMGEDIWGTLYKRIRRAFEHKRRTLSAA